ncbi:Fibronectin type III domain-containing protein [Flavobacterium sp. 9AF]|uniref:GEVED domain-containing protein n=1 Tax=Flavobacterium sp. 9AF TaxID=2653142 RepID=UPI0012F34F31|nr:GEVED domain-containing protein [Flavobacterium sp. 9AF]VXB95588.1 Fibronectin type III domain-containing protein [Flavobacterium sp. 9AF]
MKINLKTNKLSMLKMMLLLMCLKINAQFNESAPWMRNNLQETENKHSKENKTINEIVTQFEAYWKNKDKTVKGSGYKPFKRWESFWRTNEKQDGTVITPTELWAIWENKKKQSNKSIAVNFWEPIGPTEHLVTGSYNPGQGRVNVVYVDPNNSSIIYVGTPAGGIWKSLNGGNDWVPLSDNLPQIGVSSIAVSHNDSNVIYIATGDKDASNTYSIGVLKSTDGGISWSNTGLSFTNTSTLISEVIMHPNDSNTIWAATNIGLFKTINGGVHWSLVLSGDIKDIKLKPSNPNTIYAVSSTHFYKSVDSGTTFTHITSGLPATSSRLVIGVTPANSSYVYVLSAANDATSSFQGLYKSTDSGTVFTKTAATIDVFDGSRQAWYDLALAVSPSDANLIFTGCLNIWKSNDGGTSFSKVNNWYEYDKPSYTHADIHFLRYYGNKLFCGSDGGVYVSQDNGISFTDKSKGLQIGQIYEIAVSKQSSNFISGGFQDLGGFAYSNGTWKNYHGGDGTSTAIDPNNSLKFYGFTQFGSILSITNDGGYNLTESIGAPGAEITQDDLGGNWVTPLEINSVGEVFSGYERLYKLNGNSWVQQSVGTIGAGDIENIEIDPTNNNIIYLSNENVLFKSTDKGLNFTVVYTFPTIIKDIKVNSVNNNIVYVVTIGIDGLVYQSNDSAATFTAINDGLQGVAKNCIVHKNSPNNMMYVGTTLGVYYKDDTLSQWQKFDNGLPNVSVTDLEINDNDNYLIAATYGRGVWRISLPDTKAPTTPLYLYASVIGSSSVTLNWTSSLDNVGVTGYEIYKDSNLIDTSNTNTFIVNNLEPFTTYTFRIKAKDAAGNVSAFSKKLTLTTLSIDSNYCIPQVENPGEEYIENIRKVYFAGINNISTSTSAYENFTSISANVIRGNSYSITITPWALNNNLFKTYAVWIDYNNDGDFYDSGELVCSIPATNASSVNGTISIPMNATVGNLRMRIYMKYFSNSTFLTPCETAFFYGQMEDYTVNVAYDFGPFKMAHNESEEFNLYPNPVENFINTYVNSLDNVYYEICDLSGRVCMSGEIAKRINVSDLPSGIYIFTIKEGQNKKQRKFIKK